MERLADDPRLPELTAEMAWVRRLARGLLRGDEAEDAAHETYLVATTHAPDDGRPLRPWLGRVLKNVVRMRERARRRRLAREERAMAFLDPPETPEALLARVQLQELVARHVLALAEPYRSTILYRYFEGESCAQIARRLGVPEGTVRRRLKVALDQLRARLATSSEGQGLAALAPLTGISRPTLGVLAMKKILAAVVLLVLLVVLGLVWRQRARTGAAAPPPATVASGPSATSAPTGQPDARAGVDTERGPAWLAQPGAPARRIAGRVTAGGVPVAGAIVELANIATESGFAKEARRTTNAAGEFDFGPQRAMAWTVRASAPHKASARVDLDLREPTGTPPSDHLELALGSCDAALFGTVRDASGGPIAGARIAQMPEGLRPDMPLGAAVTSDDAGAYELCFQPKWPLWLGVEVSATGYAAVRYMTVAPGRLQLDFALVPEATIVGRVVRDDTGAPVPEAYVSIPPSGIGVESTPSRGTFTDANGRFQLSGVAPGRHLVTARADALAPSRPEVPVVVEAGQTSVEIEIRLEAGSTLVGTVTEHGKPIAGVHLRAIDGPTVAGDAVSQDGGAFTMRGIARGDIRFSARGYDVVAPQVLRIADAAPAPVTVEVEALGRIVGDVVRNKQPVPGAAIDIHGPNEHELAPIVADARGHFEARGLAPGPWAVAASDDRTGAFGGPPDPIQLARGATAEVTLELSYAGSISGRVVDQTGAPVAGASVLFRSTTSDDTGMTTTLADGTYRAAMMTGGGDYRPIVKRSIRATAAFPPAAGTEHPLVALSGPDSQVTGIVLAVRVDHLAIAGRVVDSAGVPVPDARVTAELVEGDQPATFRPGTQDPATTTTVNGEFAIDDLLAGTYALRVRSPSAVEATVTGVRAGRRDVTLVVPTPGAIEVTTRGFASPPQVTAVSMARRSAPATAVAQGAAYAFKSLSPGSYTITARTGAEAASAIVEVTPGKTASVMLASGGTGTIAGRVRGFRTRTPVEGMTCRVLPRSGTTSTPFPPVDGVRTDRQGAFAIAAAPAGAISIACDGLWRNYSDGLRMITLAPGQRMEIEVPVVEILDEPNIAIAGLGADFDPGQLAPRVVRIVPGGPAATAGLAEGDLVTAVDGAAVGELSVRGVWLAIVNRAVGTKVKLGITRGGKPLTVEITLGTAPHE